MRSAFWTPGKLAYYRLRGCERVNRNEFWESSCDVRCAVNQVFISSATGACVKQCNSPEHFMRYASLDSLQPRAQCLCIYLFPGLGFKNHQSSPIVGWIGLGGLTRGINPPPTRFVVG